VNTPRDSRDGVWTNSISITWELVKKQKQKQKKPLQITDPTQE